MPSEFLNSPLVPLVKVADKQELWAQKSLKLNRNFQRRELFFIVLSNSYKKKHWDQREEEEAAAYYSDLVTPNTSKLNLYWILLNYTWRLIEQCLDVTNHGRLEHSYVKEKCTNLLFQTRNTSATSSSMTYSGPTISTMLRWCSELQMIQLKTKKVHF